MKAIIKWIEYYLPHDVLTNEHLSASFPSWPQEKIKEKIGISSRHIVGDDIFASDLAYGAAKKFFETNICKPEDVDFILFCTQSPDYLLPTSVCILQNRLGIPTNCGALDFNLGCSGYVYGLGLAKGLIETGQAKNVLLLTADTYSRFLNPNDIATRSIFGDAGSATLIVGTKFGDKEHIGIPIYGTDGNGVNNLIFKNSGVRYQYCQEKNNNPKDNFLYMNGPEIFTFTLKNVPQLISKLLERESKKIKDFDLFVFHQANKYILDHLRKKIQIPEEKFYMSLEHTGNTVSSSIPIALRNAYDEKILNNNMNVMLIGFGVGYSWGGIIVNSLFHDI